MGERVFAVYYRCGDEPEHRWPDTGLFDEENIESVLRVLHEDYPGIRFRAVAYVREEKKDG
jgi:hypothetical protein